VTLYKASVVTETLQITSLGDMFDSLLLITQHSTSGENLAEKPHFLPPMTGERNS
jgi:hypothetical protein